MSHVRLGIIGANSMGAFHIGYLRDGKVSRCELTAVCDLDPKRLEKFSDYRTSTDSRELVRSGEVDAVLIATPHYSHTTIGIDALEAGLHVLVEKPISVHKADALKLLAAHRDGSQVFAAMLNLRTDPRFRYIKGLIEEGGLGEIRRVNWIFTECFRPEVYYTCVDWRGTWKGEGGGILVNQCPHHLDLMQWFCGMPVKVRAFCGFGAWHDVEVEDRVTAYMEYANGATGVFIATTGECPGTNRLEISGDRGKLLMEHSKISLFTNDVPASEYSRTAVEAFGRPEVRCEEVPVEGNGGPHHEITQNFVDAILDGTPLIAPAEEGAKSVEFANAMLYSSLTDRTVDLPLDAEAFALAHSALVANSRFVKKETAEVVADVSRSFRT